MATVAPRSLGVAAVVAVVALVLGWSKIQGIFGLSHTDTECYRETGGTDTYIGAGGVSKYFYYCATKVATNSANCGKVVTEEDITAVLNKAKTWATEHPDAAAACLKIEPPPTVYFHTKIQVSKTEEHVICDLEEPK